MPKSIKKSGITARKPSAKKQLKRTPLQHVAHHAKRAAGFTPAFVHGLVFGAFAGVLTVSLLRNTVASALAITSPRDCDTNAVVNCGALTTTELQQKYANAGVAGIYGYFGISAGDIDDIGNTAVAGVVYKNGTVTAGGATVATNAITAGRENISGSTKVSSGALTFYKRPPSVSFRANSINAFVVMQNGQFKFAILGACGNPVIATAVPKKAAVPTPPPTQTPAPTATPTPTVPTSTQTPSSTPTATLATNITVSSLPNTGPGAVVIIAALSVLGGYIFHMTHRHIRHKRRLRHAAHHA